MKFLGKETLGRRPGETIGEALERSRAARAEGQRNLLFLLVLLLVGLLVGVYFDYHGLIAYCTEYGTVP